MSTVSALQTLDPERGYLQVASKGYLDDGVLAYLVRISRTFTYHTMDGRGEALKDIFCDNGIFINGVQERSDFSVGEYVHICRQAEEHNLRIVLTHQSFVTQPQSKTVCAVVGNFHLFLSMGERNALTFARPTRVVYLWTFVDDLPRLLSLEVSFPIHASEIFLADDEVEGAQVAGTQVEGSVDVARPPIDTLADEDETWGMLIELRDIRRMSHFVSEDDIYCVEAKGRKAIVHCEGEDIEVNEGIGSLATKLGPNFVLVHRSFLVNAWHLRSISADGALLANGMLVPVPSRRLSQVRAQLKAIRKPQRISSPDLARLKAVVRNKGV